MGTFSFRGFSFLGLVALLFFLGACSVVPRELRKEIDRSISFKELRANPEAYVGRTVALGGEIIKTENLRDHTQLEILQKPLGRRDVPIEINGSGGRFLINYSGFLDTAIYRSGRYVTAVGEVMGGRSLQIGEVDYLYPVISAKFLYLWPHARRYYSPYYPYYYPYYYPFHFYWGFYYSYPYRPYWHHRHWHHRHWHH